MHRMTSQTLMKTASKKGLKTPTRKESRETRKGFKAIIKLMSSQLISQMGLRSLERSTLMIMRIWVRG